MSKVNLIDLELVHDVVGDSEVMHGVGKAIFGSFLTANPTLLEPIYKIIITVASETLRRMLTASYKPNVAKSQAMNRKGS